MAILKQNFVKYGLLMTLVTAIFVLFMHFTGGYSDLEKAGQSPIELVFIVLTPLVVWYLGLKAKKDEQKGKLTWRQGLIEGFKISLVYGITSPFWFLAYYTLLNPDMMPFMRKEYMLPDTFSDQMVIGVDMAVQFFAAIIFGTIYGAVISLFLKSKK